MASAHDLDLANDLVPTGATIAVCDTHAVNALVHMEGRLCIIIAEPRPTGKHFCACDAPATFFLVGRRTQSQVVAQ